MAARILIGKNRYQSRSDREREKLQAQISTYAIRQNAEHDAESKCPSLCIESIDSFIDWAIELVESCG